MARPGVIIVNRTAPPARGAPTVTGVWFVSGITQKGPVGSTEKIQSLTEFESVYGQRIANSVLYDAVDTFFHEGGATVYVSRIVGPAPVKATLTLQDGTAGTLKLDAKSAGSWGNSLQISVVVTGTDYEIVVLDANDVQLERSPLLADKTAAVTWSADSTYLDITSLAGTGDPIAITSVPMASGADDIASVTETQWTNALAAFTRSLGPGQVSAPGRSTTAAHTNLLTHAALNNRVALLDVADTPTVATLTSSVAGATANGYADYGAVFAPWVRVPGLTGTTTRTVPYSAVQAGVEARRDKLESPNVPAAGRAYPLRYVLSLNVEFSDADRETLLLAGVNTAKQVFGVLETYGYRSIVDADAIPNWFQFNHARLRMAISARGEDIGEGFMFDQIDGHGVKAAEFGGAITGMLLDFFNAGSLYGDTPEDAFRVDVGPSVNTAESIEAGELRAVAGVRMSPHAEQVVIEFVKTPIAQNL